MRPNAALLAAAVIVLAAGVAGCQSKFSRQAFETVYVGQPAADVEKTLGEPTVRYEDQWRYVTDFPYAMGTVFFEDGKVVRKTWVNERPSAEPAGN